MGISQQNSEMTDGECKEMFSAILERLRADATRRIQEDARVLKRKYSAKRKRERRKAIKLAKAITTPRNNT